jgi:hypothetical protein
MVFSTATNYLLSKHLLIFWKLIYFLLMWVFRMFIIILNFIMLYNLDFKKIKNK